jgi:type III secretory pathway component EscS
MKQVLGLTIFIHGDYLFDLITQKKKTEKHIIKCVCVCVCVCVFKSWNFYS